MANAETHTPLTFWILNENVDEYIEMLSRSFGYREFDVLGEPNPETRGAYAKRKIASELSSKVEEQKLTEARDEIFIPPIIIEEE